MSRVLVLGLGNLVLGDDGVGIHLVQQLRGNSTLAAGIDLITSEETGFSIIDIASGYDVLILIDSIQANESQPEGSIIEVREENYHDLSGWGSHYIGFFEMKRMAWLTSVPFPSRMYILGIAVNDLYRIDYNLSSGITRVLPDIQNKIVPLITELCNRADIG